MDIIFKKDNKPTRPGCYWYRHGSHSQSRFCTVYSMFERELWTAWHNIGCNLNFGWDGEWSDEVPHPCTYEDTYIDDWFIQLDYERPEPIKIDILKY